MKNITSPMRITNITNLNIASSLFIELSLTPCLKIVNYLNCIIFYFLEQLKNHNLKRLWFFGFFIKLKL